MCNGHDLAYIPEHAQSPMANVRAFTVSPAYNN